MKALACVVSVAVEVSLLSRSPLSLAVALFVCFVIGLMMSRDSIDVRTTSPLQHLGLGHEPNSLGGSTRRPHPAAGPERTVRQAPTSSKPNLPPALKIDLSKAFLVDDTYHLELADGHVAVLTLNPRSNLIWSRCSTLRPPAAGAVAMNPEQARFGAVPRRTWPRLQGRLPSASIFKMVTAAALVEDHGFTSQSRSATAANPTKPLPEQISTRERGHLPDSRQAFGESINPVFSSLTYKHLDAAKLETRFKFLRRGHPLPYPHPTARCRFQETR